MPFIRTGYCKGMYDTARLQKISQSIMTALIEHFNVPVKDYFQVFHEHDVNQFFYDPHYLSVERSQHLLYIQITLGAGRSREQKQNFYRFAAELLEEQAEVRQDDVFIMLIETELEDWSFGQGQAQMITNSFVRFSDKTHESHLKKSTLENISSNPPSTKRHPLIVSSARKLYNQVAPEFVRYSEDVLFGDVWRQPDLSLRERSLITIAVLVAQSHTSQMPYHFRLALTNGISKSELAACITHLAFYTGWPAAAAALQVMTELDEE